MTELIKGNYYLDQGHPTTGPITDRPLRYTGTEVYQGQTYHIFWDTKFRLKHWLQPERVKPLNLDELVNELVQLRDEVTDLRNVAALAERLLEERP